jgi:hypothetical protein
MNPSMTFDASEALDKQPRFDLTKSLHHLRRSGFDVARMTSSPRSQPVSPLRESDDGMNGRLPIKRQVEIDRSTSTESNSSYSSNWSDESTEETDDSVDVRTPQILHVKASSRSTNEECCCESNEPSSNLLRSTIDDNENDTVEVTLDRSCMHGNGSPDAFHFDYLVDEVKELQSSYPPLSPQTPIRVTFCGLPYCFETKHSFFLEDGNALGQGDSIQEGFCQSLFRDGSRQESIQSEICVSLGMEGWCWQAVYPNALSSAAHSVVEVGEVTDVPTGQKPRHIFNLSARRSRLDLMRRELHPFTDSHYIPEPVSKSHSFNHMSPPLPCDRQELQPPEIWECGSLDTVRPEPAPRIMSVHEGYDSDPEDYHNKVNSPTSSGVCAATVEEFLNERCTLILHGDKSVAMHVWIERGQQLRDCIILPKLFWKPIHGSERSSIDLVDICRVLGIGHLDRDKHPFADTRRLITVKTISREPLVFEARSVEDRDRWILLLKLTVSTLAAKFLTNDPTALSSFFLESGVLHPGRTPFHNQPQKLEAWV